MSDQSWPLWIVREQVERIVEQLIDAGFTNITMAADGQVLKTTATDPSVGDSFTTRIQTPTELWMIEGRFKSWRPKRG